ncbi:hypothetical protein [Candidatus Poriferisodalis sp.]|uniref:hypothetical protein n=1 Tax=Candidatus Poriferisodalis sp. TaxID=3101277 RepID=UPI003B517200
MPSAPIDPSAMRRLADLRSWPETGECSAKRSNSAGLNSDSCAENQECGADFAERMNPVLEQLQCADDRKLDKH